MRRKLTNTDRLSVFIKGFRLVNYQDTWWLTRHDGYREILMISEQREAGVCEGYFKSANAAIDSFIRLSRFEAAR